MYVCCSESGDPPLNAHDEDKLRFCLNVERAPLSTQSVQTNLLSLCIPVLFHVRFGSFEYDRTLFFVGLVDSCVSMGGIQRMKALH